MPILLIVRDPKRWPLSIRGVQVVAARRYLADPAYHKLPNARVFNLCQSYSYRSMGYYVSLLAAARGQRPEPDVNTIQDLKSPGLVRTMTEDLDDLIQKSLRTIAHDEFTMSIYFGRTLAKRDRPLGVKLFGRFRIPLLRAEFVRRKGEWQIRAVRAIPASEVPRTHHDAVVEAAQEYFRRRFRIGRSSKTVRYHLAILHEPEEEEPPSDDVALRKFIRAAARHDMNAELITRDDSAHVGEYDALFVRATTNMNHYTYRMARAAVADGLAVMDDPLSIARCANKVYLAERMGLNKVPTPRTMVVYDDNVDAVIGELGLPVVLKQPDSAFSIGVVKVHDEASYRQKVEELLAKSDAVIAQAFTPTEFDWRVGVLDGKPLYACKYYMAKDHWQIMKWTPGKPTRYGRCETLAVKDAPRKVIQVAVKSARLIGDGLYGVDLKSAGKKVVVIEVNDNPNLNSGIEDRVLKNELYDRIIESFIRRIERIRGGTNGKRRRAGARTV